MAATQSKRERESMARPKKHVGTTSIRINDDAHDKARIASGYTKESIVEFVSRVTLEAANKVIEAEHEKFFREKEKAKK